MSAIRSLTLPETTRMATNTCFMLPKATQTKIKACSFRKAKVTTQLERPVKFWCDNSISCCWNNLQYYQLVIGTSINNKGFEALGKFFGTEPRFINLKFGKKAVKKLVKRVEELELSPSQITIYRDGWNALYDPKLCSNCGSQYPDPKMERQFIKALEDAGFEVIIVSCD